MKQNKLRIKKYRWASSLKKEEINIALSGNYDLFYFPVKDDFKVLVKSDK
jgi:hypothetical protein